MRTLLGKDVSTGEQIWLPDKERRRGMYILGVHGSGKSALLVSLILQDLKKGYGAIVFDSHGDLIRYVISLLPPERIGKTYLLDMSDVEYPFGLNLFAGHEAKDELERMLMVERVMHIFMRRWPDIRGVLAEKLLRYITPTFAENRDCTLADIPRLLRDDTYRRSLVEGLRNQEVKAYWLQEYNSMTPGEQRRETQAIDNRIVALVTTTAIRNILCQRKTTLDFRRSIDEQEVLLVNLPKKVEEHAALIGTILFADLHAAIFSFSDLDWDKRPGYSIYIDEFQRYTTPDIAEIIKEGRKYGARITLAHQDRRDLAEENRSATLMASTIVSFHPAPSDAGELAPLFFDPSARLRPERIYHDVLPRLRRHERQDVRDFYATYVVPLWQMGSGSAEGQEIIGVVEDLLYQSVVTRAIHEQLLDTYLQRMYSHLELTTTEPLQKRRRIHDRLRHMDHDIELLQSYLGSERATQAYLSIYYAYHPISPQDRPIRASEELLADTAYWTYLLSGGPGSAREHPEVLLRDLERLALANRALHARDTPQKIIAKERARVIARYQMSFTGIWESIAVLHELKSVHAEIEAVRAWHAEAYRTCLATPLAQKPAPVFLYPAADRITGSITRQTRPKDLITRALPFAQDSIEVATSWLADEECVYPLGDHPPVNRYSEACKLWQTIVQHFGELQQAQQLLADEVDLMRAYYREKALLQDVGEQHGGMAPQDVWERVQREARRNAWLSSRQDTVSKIIQQRVIELRWKIAQLIEERDTYKASLPLLEREIAAEITAIEERRAAFKDYVRRIIQILIDDPGPLGEQRTPRESDTRAELLNLPPRQAKVRLSGGANQQPRKCTMRTLDLPPAAAKDEVERRLQQIREQTRAKYCRPRREVEMELGDTSGTEPPEDHGQDSWYEE